MFPLYVRNESSSSILGVFRPVYVIARIFGLFPFSLNLEQSFILNKPFISKVDLVLLSFHLLVYVSFVFLNIYTNTHRFVKLSPVLEIGNRVVLIGGISSGIGMIIYDLCNRKYLWNILRKFEIFDQEIRVVAVTINYNEHCKYFRKYLIAWGLLSLIFVIYTTAIYLNYFPVIPFAALLASYTLSNGVFTTILSIYTFFLYNLKVRYNLLNRNLKHLLSSPQIAINIKVFGSDETISRLKMIANLHNVLNDVMELVNLCYSKQVMVCVGACFSFTVFTLFGIYTIWFIVDIYTDPQFRIATALLAWAIYYNYFVIWVLSSGSDVRSEGKHIGVIIHRFINKCSNRMLIERLMTISQQIVHRIPEATCKLFVFDWTVLFSLISATATYLIILIQFDSSSLRAKHES